MKHNTRGTTQIAATAATSWAPASPMHLRSNHGKVLRPGRAFFLPAQEIQVLHGFRVCGLHQPPLLCNGVFAVVLSLIALVGDFIVFSPFCQWKMYGRYRTFEIGIVFLLFLASNARYRLRSTSEMRIIPMAKSCFLVRRSLKKKRPHRRISTMLPTLEAG